MAKTIQTAIEAGSRMAPAKFYIKITPDGPYLLYGNPPMMSAVIHSCLLWYSCMAD